MPENARKAALYVRVGMEHPAEKRVDVASQLRALREAAAAEGYEVADEFVDDGDLAALTRPALHRLREAVRRGAFDVVLAYSPRRLGRDLGDTCLLWKEFSSAGVDIEYAVEDRPSEGEVRLFSSIMRMFSEIALPKLDRAEELLCNAIGSLAAGAPRRHCAEALVTLDELREVFAVEM